MIPELRIVLPLRFNEGIRDYCSEVFRGHLPHTSLSVSFLLDAVNSTVSDYDQFRNAPWMLKAVQAAIRDGCHGVFLNVAFDTALVAAKSLAPIPVVGALESAVAYARTLCRRFSIIAINDEEVPVDYRLAREYGFADLLTSVEPIHIPVLELRDDPEFTLSRLAEASERAVQSGAQAVVLGCTAMGWAVRPLAARVAVPVIDTNLVGLYMLDTLVQLGLAPSRLEHIRPSGLVDLTDDEYGRMQAITFRIPSAT